MKNIVIALLIIFVASYINAADITTLEVGACAPNFDLVGIDNLNYTLESFKNDKILVIIFTANHCPTAQAYEDKIIDLVNDYQSKGVAVIAISSNHPDAVLLEELGYTDLGDNFEEMQIRARDKKFNFSYLYDGDTQETAIAYGPMATPHAFVFDSERKLCYQGRIDDTENPYIEPKTTDLKNAIDAILADKPVEIKETKVFGCSMKWKEKVEWKKNADLEWSQKPVTAEQISIEDVKSVIKNDSDNFRLINVWATWCGPCVVEFPELIKINRMYKGRNFELVTISTDKPEQKSNVLTFLSEKQAAVTNYIFNSSDVYSLMELIDKKWPGGIPYTLLIAPGGEIVYSHVGLIEPLEVKKVIVEHLGRYYADNK